MKKIYLRLDDIGIEDKKNTFLIKELLALNIPISCQIVPFWLLNNKETSKELIYLKKKYDYNLELFQHGFAHFNHALSFQKKYEFGNNRSYIEQYNDILNGKMILSDILGVDNFTLGFCPPHDRLNNDTLKALKALNFKYVTASKFMYDTLSIPKSIKFSYFNIDISEKYNGYRTVVNFQKTLDFIKNTKLNTIGIVIHGNEFLNIEQCSVFIKIIKNIHNSNKYLFSTIANL